MLPFRNLVLMAVLAATVAASLIDFESSEVVASPKATVTGLVRAATPRAVEAAPSAQTRFQRQDADAFAARSWQPPPPRPVPVTVAEPKAPPLPFRYLGKVMEEGAVVAFIALDARTYLAHKGDVLLDYRIEDVTPAQMTFVYLPLNEKQTLTFGSAN